MDYHNSDALRTWWWRHADRILLFFSFYALQLNLIERLQQVAGTVPTGLELHFHATDGPALRPRHNS